MEPVDESAEDLQFQATLCIDIKEREATVGWIKYLERSNIGAVSLLINLPFIGSIQSLT